MATVDHPLIISASKKGGITQAQAAKQLGITRQRVNILVKQRRLLDQPGAVAIHVQTPTVVKDVAPGWGSGPAPAPTPAPALPPKSLDELLKGPPPPPSIMPDGFKPAPAPAPPAAPAPTAPAVIVDERAAKIGCDVIKKARAAMVRNALRYFAGVNPNDPEILDLLPPGMATDVRSRVSYLDLVCDSNPQITAKIGQFFLGPLGFIFGLGMESWDIVSTVRMVAARQGVPMPENRRREQEEEADEKPGEVPQVEPPKPSHPSQVFDINNFLPRK